MKPDTQFSLLDLQLPHNDTNSSQLCISLQAGDDRLGRRRLLDIGTTAEAAGQFLVLEFPELIKEYPDVFWSPDGHQVELIVQLAHPAGAVKVHDLVSMPPEESLPKMMTIFAGCPAALAIVVYKGHIQIALCNGE